MKVNKFLRVLQYIALLSFYFVFFAPVIWIIYSSFRVDTALFSGKIFSNPDGLTLLHYKNTLFTGEHGPFFMIYTWNSFRVAVLVVLLVLVIGLAGSYVLSRYRMKARSVLLFTMLSSQMFPSVLVLLSIFAFFYRLNLTDSIIGIALGHVIGALPFGILMMKSYIDSIPKELDESARIDGLGIIGIIRHVILPLAAPGIAVAAFYAFMISWGDYLYASVISTSISTQTLPLGLARYFSSQQVKWGIINAATVISIAPTILIFALLQRHVVSGLTSGAVKG